MKVLVSGATGLIGRAVCARLKEDGHEAVALTRRANAGPDARVWEPTAPLADPEAVAGFDAVIHLAGEPIAVRWSPDRKRLIRESRVAGTRHLAEALARCSKPPKTLVSASAIGYYGDRGAEPLDEDAAPGSGFLAEVCVAWEEAAESARAAGIRVVHPRIGVVLSPEGGALGKLLPVFRMGAGGPVGTGEQVVSWIALPDAAAALVDLAANDTIRGPVNLVAPHPVTNADFAAAIGKVLHRPAVMKVPAMTLRMMFGEMADETILASQNVMPRALTGAGFTFRAPEIEPALRLVLNLPQ